ncbi:MAG: polynucleotide adenylyltransferase PcnB [Thermodesulfobacteriota bacterium]
MIDRGRNTTQQRPVTVIPRSEHPISRKDIDPDALRVLYKLKNHSYQAYLVGGSIRDLFLGRKPKDFDVVTNARPSEIKELFRNSRLIGRRFRLIQVFFKGGKVVEVSTFRCRSEFDTADETLLQDNNTYGTPEEDALRRDLTINALFYNIADFSVLDYVGGVEDLKHGIIRVIGDPETRFFRDPVRMMRAIRHAARTGFTIEENTRQAIEKNRDRIWLCPVSRIRDEWLRDLTGGSAAACVDLMIKTSFFFSLFPFYEPVLKKEAEDLAPFLLALLRRLDRLRSEGTPVSQAFMFALFLLPWFRSSGLAWSPSAPPPNPWFTEDIRQAVHAALGIFDIKRSDRENASHLLAAQPVLSEIAASGQIPRRLRPRRYPFEAIRLFLLAAEAEEKLVSPSTIRLLYKPARSVKKQPWRSRKKRRSQPKLPS